MIQKEKGFAFTFWKPQPVSWLLHPFHPGSSFLHPSEVPFYQNDNPKCTLTAPVAFPCRLLWEAGMSGGSFACTTPASSFSWPPVSIALLAPSRSVMGTAPKIQNKAAKTDGERLSGPPCWIFLSLPTEYMGSKTYLTLNSEVPQMHGQSDYITLFY